MYRCNYSLVGYFTYLFYLVSIAAILSDWKVCKMHKGVIPKHKQYTVMNLKKLEYFDTLVVETTPSDNNIHMVKLDIITSAIGPAVISS